MSEHRAAPTSSTYSAPSAPGRLRRRLLLGSTASAAVTGAATLASAARAEAAPPTDTWKLGGNTGVNATNYLGTNNAVPLIFKTKPTSGAVKEAMRITPTQRVGIGTTSPKAQVHVKGDANVTIRGVNTVTSGSPEAVNGQSGYIGVRGVGEVFGLRGEGGDYGGYLTGDAYGIFASAPSSGYGGYFNAGTGVYGTGNTTGASLSGGSYGVLGIGGSRGGDFHGHISVYGHSSDYAGVAGDGTTWGVIGQTLASSGTSYGVFGEARTATGGTPYAGGFAGNVVVYGTLSKSAGSFRIDHPLDPQNSWLSHSFVESPDMMNVYNGNVDLDEQGAATVTLPDYFHALNRDFRYQLTAIGAAAPDLHVAAEVQKGRFRVAGGPPGGRVSWQVTGIRHDSYAKAHPIEVVTPKSEEDRGTLLFVPPGSRARPMPIERLEAGEDPPAQQPHPRPPSSIG